jgi:hypothetical protein
LSGRLYLFFQTGLALLDNGAQAFLHVVQVVFCNPDPELAEGEGSL